MNNDPGKISMKAMMVKFLKGIESTGACVKEIRSALSTMIQLLDSYSASIKNLEK